MHVVEQQRDAAAVALPPGAHRVAVDRVDQLGGELGRAETGHRAEAPLDEQVTDRVEQVGLPRSAPADQDERVVAPTRLLHHDARRLEADPSPGAFDEVGQLPDRGRRRRRHRTVPGPQQERLRGGHIRRIAERGRAGQLRGQLPGLRLHPPEPLHVALEAVHHLVRIGSDVRVEQRLEAPGSIPLALPAQDRGADLGPPRVHLQRDGRVDLTQEVGEFVFLGGTAGRWDGGRPPRLGLAGHALDRSFESLGRTAAPPVRRTADQLPRLGRREGRVAHRLVSDHPVQRAQQLADVVDTESGHRLEHAFGERRPSLLRLAPEDGHPGLVVGGGDVDDEAAREAADQPLVQGLDLRRRPVTGEDDLPVCGLQGVGQPEQLRLHLATMGEELHVVHQEQIHVEEPLAVGVALPRGDSGVERLDELVEGEILHRQPRIDRAGRVAHTHEQVGLAQSGSGVDEQRVVHRARRLGHRLGGGDRQAVGRSDHVGLEAVEGVQGDGHATGVPAARRLRTISEMPRSVSNTPVP